VPLSFRCLVGKKKKKGDKMSERVADLEAKYKALQEDYNELVEENQRLLRETGCAKCESQDYIYFYWKKDKLSAEKFDEAFDRNDEDVSKYIDWRKSSRGGEQQQQQQQQ